VCVGKGGGLRAWQGGACGCTTLRSGRLRAAGGSSLFTEIQCTEGRKFREASVCVQGVGRSLFTGIQCTEGRKPLHFSVHSTLGEEKFEPATLRKLFIVGQKTNQYNIAESFQSICRTWVGKHLDASATEYHVGMMAATLHGNERYEFGLNPNLPTWHEKLFARGAHRNGTSPGAGHMLGRRAGVKAATVRAKYRRS
jgi:hypothetical protein